jgi:hypothetical protein
MLPPNSESSATRIYALVVVSEVLAIAALWLLGRAFSLQ